MFADQGASQKILELLKIENSCLLRGDYYHLMEQVWPLPENFGQPLMSQIAPFLRMMLLSRNRLTFVQSYDNAVKFVKNDPLRMAKLNMIRNNESYYAGYKLREIIGNLDMNGSVASEQRHASNVAHFGPGGSGWSIMNHVSELVKREAEHIKRKKKATMNYTAEYIIMYPRSKDRQV